MLRFHSLLALIEPASILTVLAQSPQSVYLCSCPRKVLILCVLSAAHHLSRPSTNLSDALGSTKWAVPTSTAVAPASMYSTISVGFSIPPSPTTGILTALQAS